MRFFLSQSYPAPLRVGGRLHGAFAVCFAAETLTRDTRVRNDDDNSVVLFFRSQFLFFVFVSRWVCVQHNGFRFLGGVCVCVRAQEKVARSRSTFFAHTITHTFKRGSTRSHAFALLCLSAMGVAIPFARAVAFSLLHTHTRTL